MTGGPRRGACRAGGEAGRAAAIRGAVSRWAREALAGLLDLLYPPKCQVCGVVGPHPLCTACRSSFEALPGPLCAQCGLPAAHSELRPLSAGGAPLCPACRPGAGHHFAAARAAGGFQGPLRQAILRLKYGGRRALAEPLGAYLADFLSSNPFGDDLDVIVPVPLHPSRLRARGFNQAALLCCQVGARLGVPVDAVCLRRVRRTRPQVTLRAGERARNVRGAFAVERPHLVDGKTVLLIDDVVTTCHTVDECARVLSDAGARRVYVASVARGL
jgi:competence protein ComFC